MLQGPKDEVHAEVSSSSCNTCSKVPEVIEVRVDFLKGNPTGHIAGNVNKDLQAH
jgi:hypothetical protein